MKPRYAIYFVPEKDSQLADFGNTVLGRNANGDWVAAPSLDYPGRNRLVKKPGHYGFHATLVAPFTLADSVSIGELQRAVESLACRQQIIPLTGLKPYSLTDFSALVLPSNGMHPSTAHQRVLQLSSECITELSRYRAPLTSEDLARRNPSRLTDRQRHYLQQFGYPYVFEDFNFHMTLSSHSDHLEDYIDWLRHYFSQLVTTTPQLDRLVICWQIDCKEPFRRFAEYVFTTDKSA